MSGDNNIVFNAEAGGVLQGRLRVPGDKSISHRSIMLGTLAEGTTEVTGFLEGEDCLATIGAFRAMGVRSDGPADGRVTVHGVGLHGLRAPSAPLYMGNSGTSMRLLAGLMAGQPFEVVMTGDASLTRRPMKRVAEPLRRMGAVIDTSATGTPPLRISGNPPLRAIEYTMPVARAQVKSSLLLAGCGYPVEREGSTVCIEGGGRLRAMNIDVPADISSAAFFMVGAAIAPGSDLTLEHVGVNPTRIGVINILRAMGADITLGNERTVGGEPVADIRVRASRLRGIRIPEDQVPLAIDEFPALFVAAACAEGETVLPGAEELRVKESDRILVMADGLAALGVDATPTPGGMMIRGGVLAGGRIDSRGDHRIAMSCTMAALRANGPVLIDDCANVRTSFPYFLVLAAMVGMRVR